MKAIMVGKVKWKSIELPLPTKIVNKKNCISERFAKISATIKDLEDAGLLIHHIAI